MNPRVMLATPCTDQVKAGFALDLAKLVGYTARVMPHVELSVVQNRGTIIPHQRATLVVMAQQAGCSHILFVDSDMRFPKDALERLLAHDAPIVAANYPTRRIPILPTAIHKDHGHLFTPRDAEGLVEVTHCGMGLMLVEMSVFEAVAHPWFQTGHDDGGYFGEDYFFCWRARDVGIVTLVDQALSTDVRHVGDLEYTNEHALVTRSVANQKQEVVSGV